MGLDQDRHRLLCASGHSFAVTRRGIPIFDPPEARADETETVAEEESAAAYAGMRAFATEAIGRGESEGLYRTVSDLKVARPPEPTFPVSWTSAVGPAVRSLMRPKLAPALASSGSIVDWVL